MKRVALWGDLVVRPIMGVTVLIYHRVGGETSSSVDLDEGEFSWQMQFLANNQLTLTMDEALRRLATGDATPGVVVTFDDGTRDFTERAFPIMVRWGIPGLLYAETGPITSGTPNAAGHEPTSWAALSDAVSSGLLQVGSHTHTHRLLRDLDAPATVDELERSIEAITNHLGFVPEHFAYPKAVDGSEAANIEIRRRFRSAALGGGRTNRPGTDPFRLLRTPIQRSDCRKMFVSKVHGGMRVEGMAREVVARRRYRHLDR